MNICKSIYFTTLKTGGCSYSFQEMAKVKKGFAVSIFPYCEEIVEIEEFTPITVYNYVISHYEELYEEEGTYLGIWNADGDIYLDVSRSFETLEEALKVAKENDQIAVYNLETKEEIFIEDEDGKDA